MATNFKDQKKDTYYRMSWDEFKKICVEQGFEVMTENVGKNLPEVPEGEERLQMLHPAKELILICESGYGMQAPHSAVIQGNVRKREGVGMIACEQVHQLCRSYTLVHRFNDIQTVTIDAREKMIQKLDQLEDNYEYPYVTDTYPNMDWSRFLELCREQGFQLLGTKDDKYTLRHLERFLTLTAMKNVDVNKLIYAEIIGFVVTVGGLEKKVSFDATQNMVFYLNWLAKLYEPACDWEIEDPQILQPVVLGKPGKQKRL